MMTSRIILRLGVAASWFTRGSVTPFPANAPCVGVSRALLTLSAIGLVAGCHGGGGAASLPSTVAQGKAVSPVGVANFRVTIPAPGGPDPIPQSVVISLTAGNGQMAPVTMNVSATMRGCKMVAGGATCVASVTAPTGADRFTIETYSGPNATGTRIASVQTSATVTGVARNACPVPSAVLQSIAQHDEGSQK